MLIVSRINGSNMIARRSVLTGEISAVANASVGVLIVICSLGPEQSIVSNMIAVPCDQCYYRGEN